MNSVLSLLKEQATVLNGVILFLIVSLLCKRFQKRKAANLFFIITVVYFLLISTNYLPDYLAYQLEKNYPPLSSSSSLQNNSGKTYIHLLGSGYTPDKKLPPNSQLGLVALGRLSEAVRIFRLLDSAKLVCSGNAPYKGLETQAEVAKDAAIVMGVDSNQIETLNTPNTTKEEAEALLKNSGKDIKVIIVTDAMHMPRAMRLFKNAGFNNLVAAPTNFKTNGEYQGLSLRWWPSINNINLSNQILHEYLGNIKEAL